MRGKQLQREAVPALGLLFDATKNIALLRAKARVFLQFGLI